MVDQRRVTSSNGAQELRFVILTEIVIGEKVWPIEISLSDRREMNYRMLLGRQALQAGRVLIDPGSSFCQPKLGFKLYPGFKPKRSTRK